jgi:hypothetical protein
MSSAQSSNVRWCRNCNRPDRDLALDAMKRHEPGTVGWTNALRSWSPEPCVCRTPSWEVED